MRNIGAVDNDFAKKIEELKISKGELAKRMRVSPSTVTRWSVKCPQTVMLYLEAQVQIRSLEQELQKCRRVAIEAIGGQ